MNENELLFYKRNKEEPRQKNDVFAGHGVGTYAAGVRVLT